MEMDINAYWLDMLPNYFKNKRITKVALQKSEYSEDEYKLVLYYTNGQTEDKK